MWPNLRSARPYPILRPRSASNSFHGKGAWLGLLLKAKFSMRKQSRRSRRRRDPSQPPSVPPRERSAGWGAASWDLLLNRSCPTCCANISLAIREWRNLRSLSKRSSSCSTKNYQRFERRHVIRDRITIGGSYHLIGTYEASLSGSGESPVVYGDKSRHSRKEGDMNTKERTGGAGVGPAFLDRRDHTGA